MSNILSISADTSGRLGSVAIALDNKIIAKKTFTGQMKHGAELFPAIERLLSDSNYNPLDIKHLYIPKGPGSFTGIRIAITMAKSMYLANKSLKIVAISTLDAIANCQQPIENKRLGVILDAKRGQFYTAIYDENLNKISDDCICTPDEFLEKLQNQHAILTGEGLVYYKDKFKRENITFCDEKYWASSATEVFNAARKQVQAENFTDPIKLLPEYMRNAVATPPKKR